MLFLEALVALFIYDIIAKCCHFKAIYMCVKKWKVAPKAGDQEALNRVCSAVNLACAWYPKRALCLQRTFVTTYLLRRNGVPAQMVLGAQKLPFKAHAWVEVNGQAINERSNVRATYAIWDRC